MAHHRTHVVLSVWPMALLYAVGGAHMWPAVYWAPSFAARSPASWLSLVAFTATTLVFFGAYFRGWSDLALGRGESGPYRSAGSVRLQRLAGGAAWGFLFGWLVMLWWMTVRAGPVALSHYEILRTVLSHPLAIGIYAFGAAAVGLYLSQGVAASFRAWGVGQRAKSSMSLEVLCTLGAAFVMLLAVNILSHFATGRAYWSPSSEPPSARAESRVR